ncbi:conserved hypothetical protein [Cytophaga hutchinsonii ATCC 33406]|uniref:Uncharacterized protein n=2 Tax=Cytophaga hutchinsonii TaxID=985 RepID=A0A6N4SU20_CYTH3|nr:conserved hypothetical protein [Cytophaga hutchinsonii ATCC 33406]
MMCSLNQHQSTSAKRLQIRFCLMLISHFWYCMHGIIKMKRPGNRYLKCWIPFRQKIMQSPGYGKNWASEWIQVLIVKADWNYTRCIVLIKNVYLVVLDFLSYVMHLFLLLLSSFLLGLICFVSYRQIAVDMRKSFLFLISYRFVFFCIQSILFYTVYQNQLDAVFYHTALVELFQDFKTHPSDLLIFLQGNYSDLHVSSWLQAYLSEEVRVAFFLKILSPFFLLSAADYYLLGAWLTLFGTLCFMPFLRLVRNEKTFTIWLLVLCVPSFTIWTVGVLKEAFVIPVLFFLYYLLHHIIQSKGKNVLYIVFFIGFILLVWYIKYYLVAVFLLVCFIYCAGTFIKINSTSILITAIVFVLLVIGLGHLHPALQWNVLPEVIYISYTLTCTKFVDAYACIPFDLDMSWNSIILNYPKAMLYAFFSPFPWQIHNVTSLVAALESYLFVGLFCMLLYNVAAKKITISKIEILTLVFVLFAGALLILASPNIGSFSRYRIFYLPFYVYILLKYSGIGYTILYLRFKNRIEK